MCYGTQLIEFDDSFRRENQRLKQRMKRFWADQEHKRELRYYANAFGRPMWPVITAERPEEAQEMQWGLVPAHIKDPKEFLRKWPTFNAVSETAYDRNSFAPALNAGRRCLVPVTGFYEWFHLNKVTFPHFIKLKSRETFCLAGIYDNGTYSILTTEANELMAQVHNRKKRMPVILTPEGEETWLSAGLSKEDVLALCKPYPADDMTTWITTFSAAGKSPLSDMSSAKAA